MTKYTALTCSFPKFETVCCSTSSSNCCFLTWIQVSQEAGKVVWYSHRFQNFPQIVIPTQRLQCSKWSRCFSGILLLFLWSNGCRQLISSSSAFSKSSLYIWKFLVHILQKPSLEDFKHYLASMWNECNCKVVWTWYWNKVSYIKY